MEKITLMPYGATPDASSTFRIGAEASHYATLNSPEANSLTLDNDLNRVWPSRVYVPKIIIVTPIQRTFLR